MKNLKQRLVAAALLSCLTFASAPALANGIHEDGYFGGGYTSIGPGPYYLRHNAGRIGPLHEGRYSFDYPTSYGPNNYDFGPSDLRFAGATY